MTSELDRMSATLNDRMTEVERAVPEDHPGNVRGTESSHQEEITRLDARIEAGFWACSRDVDELREGVTQNFEGHTAQARSGLEARLLM